MSVVLVSAGHGSGDPGAVYNGVSEADEMLKLRDIVALKLRDAGVQVRTDGARGENLSLREAMKRIPGTAVAVELHLNASTNPAARGVEAISLPAQADVARKLAKAVQGVLGTSLRGDAGWIDQSKSARGKLGFVSAGGIILEVCFLSNPAEFNAYQEKTWLVASAIAGVLKAEV